MSPWPHAGRGRGAGGGSRGVSARVGQEGEHRGLSQVLRPLTLGPGRTGVLGHL